VIKGLGAQMSQAGWTGLGGSKDYDGSGFPGVVDLAVQEMLGEMFPNQIRGSGLAVSGLFQWGSNFVITMTFPILLAGIGLAGAYGFYAFSAILSALFVMKFVYETKGIELEDMKG
jgi:alkylation response protein AidB-like acyl-CoA dehydrogenase